MIKATIINTTDRNKFAKANPQKIANGECVSRQIFRGLVLNNYKLIGSGTCKQKSKIDNNKIILFAKENQREVA